MSSDSSDVDYEIEVPKDVVVRGKKGKPLRPANEKERRGRKRRSQQQSDDSDEGEFRAPPPRNRQVVTANDSLSDEERLSVENEPPSRGGGRPQSKVGDVESSEDEEGQNEWANEKKKTRKRRSLRLSRAGSAAPSTASSAVGAPRHDAETLKTIYATCMDLFQTHKITQENAFQLRFLDLMGEILDMPDFNKNDMHNAGRMLETGAKIYVCRVDKTKHSVLDLASTLSMQSKKKKTGKGDEGNEDDQGGFDDGGDFAPEEVQKKARNRGKKKMKEQRFIVDNEAKISLTLEDDTATPAMRRETLKAKFNGVGEEDKDFDYQSFFYESPSENPFLKEGADTFDSLAPLSEAMIFRAEAQTVGFMPFAHRKDWQSSLLDIWGIPLIPGTELAINDEPHMLNEVEGQNALGHDEEAGDNGSYMGDVGGGDDFGHEDLEEANNGNDTFVDEDGIQRNQEGMIVVNQQRFNNLKDFYNMYSAIKAKFGWCGPAFVKSTNFLNNNANNNQKKPRVKREPVLLDLRGAIWNSAQCKYDTSQSQKTVFDERAIEKWSSVGRITIPFLGYENDDDDLDFKYLDAVLEHNEDDENYLPTIPHIFRYFLDHKSNVIQNIRGFIRDDDDGVLDQFVRDEEDYIEDAGFDIERHRDGEDLDADIGMDNGIHQEDHALEASILPASLGLLCMQSDFDPVSGTDGDSVKFTKKPKPIDMHALKRSITRFLNQRLQLGDGGVATSEEDMNVDLRSLILDVCQTGDRRMVEHLTIPIIIVGLMHVVVDKKLFVVPDGKDPSNPRITKRGKLWEHARHIPQPVDNIGFDTDADD